MTDRDTELRWLIEAQRDIPPMEPEVVDRLIDGFAFAAAALLGVPYTPQVRRAWVNYTIATDDLSDFYQDESGWLNAHGWPASAAQTVADRLNAEVDAAWDALVGLAERAVA